MAELGPKEREVMRLRFGLDGGEREDAAGDRRSPEAVAGARAADRVARQGETAPQLRSRGCRALN